MHKSIYVGILAVAIAAIPLAGQHADLRRVLDSARARMNAPGAIVGIEFGNDSTLLLASGVADIESGRPIRSADAYFLGSVSKLYTAVVVLRLIESGRVTLDDPIQRFIPGFARGRDVTVRNLLAHTSGLKDFYSQLYYRPIRADMIEAVTKSWQQEELLALADSMGFSFGPGEDWAYSNTNYFLLGVIIERVTGASLAEAYDTYIFQPLGMRRSWLTRHEAPRAPLPITGYLGHIAAWEHSAMFGELGPTTVLDHSPIEWGAGGLAAPAEEVLRFMTALMTGQVLAAQSLTAMMEFNPTPPLGVGLTVPDRSSGYGLGLVRMERPRYTVVGHGGLFTGHTAGVWYLPRCGLTVALFVNRGFVGQRALLDTVVDAISTKRDYAQCLDDPV